MDHPFNYYEENELLIPGSNPVSVDLGSFLQLYKNIFEAFLLLDIEGGNFIFYDTIRSIKIFPHINNWIIREVINSPPNDISQNIAIKKLSPFYSFETNLCFQLKIPYNYYLNTVHWKLIRQKVYDENNGFCQLCRDKGVDVHHNSYNNLFKESRIDLVLLCRDCHLLFHENKKLYNHNLKLKKDE